MSSAPPRARRSEELFSRARRVIPGGVNSPVRAFSAVGGTPRFIDHAAGPYLWDVDGNRYVDFVMSWGPLIHGHAFGPVVAAIHHAAEQGTSFGAPTESEVTLASLIADAMPAVQMVRFVNSGTEAAMSAVRLARGVTGRDLIVKFAGNYHGHADGLLARAGSGSLTFGIPSSPGVPESTAATTIVAQYNDIGGLEQVFERSAPEIAAIIVEPIAGNMGIIPPAPGFLEAIQRLCRASGSLFICDEVITGFRVAHGGAQSVDGISPDITILGKIIGGGLPVGAYGGRREILEQVAPSGPIYQAGTLSGSPLAMAAGLAALRHLQDASTYERLGKLTAALAAGLRRRALSVGVPAEVNAVTGMLTVFFTSGPVGTLAQAESADTRRYARFFHGMLNRGVYLPPSQFEAWMLSTSHGEEEIAFALQAAEEAFSELTSV
jgi:glutamate-1-semialdehyde 2,1-aminomutase